MFFCDLVGVRYYSERIFGGNPPEGKGRAEDTKYLKKVKKMYKNFANSKKSSNFAVRFEPLAIALGC